MNEVHFSSKYTTWETPQWLFDKLNEEFSFTLDPCCTKETAKCSKYYTLKEDGLVQDWSGETVFVNPPYGGKDIVQWVRKAHLEAMKGTVIVMLLPARTSTRWFHDWIYGFAEIRLIKKRLKFLINKEEKASAPFPSMIVVFNEKINKARQLLQGYKQKQHEKSKKNSTQSRRYYREGDGFCSLHI